ncbi:helix-turn-helix domain-containing protein [Hyphomicrobium denitrificans]|nr:helix-turn-helix transcriptional regulator [Hyphomicrobium denitrificans]
MITAAQMRAARALLGIDQQTLAELAGVSLPTIQRMEASEGNVRGIVATLMKVVGAFEAAGVELIGETTPSTGQGRGVRMKERAAVPVAMSAPPTVGKKRSLPRTAD